MEHLELCEISEFVPNIEISSVGLFDLQLEKQVTFLEYFKQHKDIERGKARGKGFGNCWKLNSKRDPKVYTYLEEEFDRLACDCGFTNLAHEVRIKARDSLNKNHTFKLDFFDPKTRINIEISPNWHKNYLLVARRDALRKRLLKNQGIRSLTVPVARKGKACRIDLRIAKRVLKVLANAKPSPECLDFYIRGVN